MAEERHLKMFEYLIRYNLFNYNIAFIFLKWNSWKKSSKRLNHVLEMCIALSAPIREDVALGDNVIIRVSAVTFLLEWQALWR